MTAWRYIVRNARRTPETPPPPTKSRWARWERDKPDENVEYYAHKLEAVYKKFQPFLETAAPGQLDLEL
jgi:hypothetical protein